MADLVPGDPRYGSLPFDEQIDFFRQKVRLPSEKWTDLLKGQHARAFVVAGATRDDLLADLQAAVEKGIADGTTLEQFRKDFDAIVENRGWSYKGSRGFRTRTIYTTNLRTSYQAGRHEQMKEVAATRPFWEYKHGDSKHPRPLHKSWDGLVLRADDPWWKEHYAPNGWGCTCTVFTRSERELKQLGKTGPDAAPDNGSYGWKNPNTGEVEQIPNGIDPGWNYNVGEAAYGRIVPRTAAAPVDDMEPLSARDWQSEGRPQVVPIDPPKAKLGSETTSREELEARLRETLGGPQKVFTYKAGDVSLPMCLDARQLTEHLARGNHLERGRYVPFIPELIEDPFEVWLSFEKSVATGRVYLRQRFVKAIETGAKEALFMVFDAQQGLMADLTFVPATRASYLKKVRRGTLLFARESGGPAEPVDKESGDRSAAAPSSPRKG
jgi:hypothetical protein